MNSTISKIYSKFKSHIALVTIVIPVFTFSCEECTECLNYDNEPYVKLRFFTKSDLQPASVEILEINEYLGSDVPGFESIASEFLLPLSMNDDFSNFVITYSNPADSTFYLDSMDISYTRRIESTSEDYVDIICYFTTVFEYSFDSLSLICKDTLGNCKSNEAVIYVFF